MAKIEIGPFEFQHLNSQSRLVCPEKISIEENELVYISGQSGAGKSTLLALIKGIYPYQLHAHFSGEILVDQARVDQISPQKIVYQFQNPHSQMIHSNVKEEFVFGMENFSFSDSEIEMQKEKLLNLFELTDLWGAKTSHLSTGQCQRLLMASNLAIKPEILLLDEPTAFLDQSGREEFYQILRSLKNKMTILIIDHHVNSVAPLADKLINVSNEGVVRVSDQIPPCLIDEELDDFHYQHTSSKLEIIVQNLSFAFLDRKIVNDFSERFRSGEVVVLLGKNGQGKSTIFKLLSGLLKPQSGKIEYLVEGESLPQKKWNKVISFVFQNPENDFYFETAEEEISHAEKMGKTQRKLILPLIQGLPLNLSPFLYSEGQKRRLSLALNILQGKQVIFYDEPTFGQDRQNEMIIEQMILALKKTNKIQLIITHNHQLAKKVADRVLLLDHSEVREFDKGQL